MRVKQHSSSVVLPPALSFNKQNLTNFKFTKTKNYINKENNKSKTISLPLKQKKNLNKSQKTKPTPIFK